MINVSIVTYYTPVTFLKRCIESLRSFNNVDTIFVIDNSPEEFSKDFSADYDCFYLWNPSNSGYGAGHNIAIRKSIERGADFHIVVNADTYFEDDVIGVLFKEMSNDATLGLCAPDITDECGRRQFLAKAAPTPGDFLIRLIGPRWLQDNRAEKFQFLEFRDNVNIYAPYQSGCFMFFRVAALKDVGLFDERFFMYPEDIDISRRIAEKWKVKSTSKCSLVHLHNAESKRNLRMLFVHILNMIKYFNKWGWIFDKRRVRLNKMAFDLNFMERNSGSR